MLTGFTRTFRYMRTANPFWQARVNYRQALRDYNKIASQDVTERQHLEFKRLNRRYKKLSDKYYDYAIA